MSNTNKVLAMVLPLALAGVVNCGSPAAGGGSHNGGTAGAHAGTSGVAGKGGTTGMGGGAGSGTAKGGTSGTGGSGAGTGAGGTGGESATAACGADAIICFKFDEGTGTKVTDSTAHHNDGSILQGAVDPSPEDPNPKWSAGRTGTATDKSWEANGLDEWIRIPKSDSIDSTAVSNAVTVSIWVYVNAVTLLKPFNCMVDRNILGTRDDHYILGMLNGAPVVYMEHQVITGPQDVPLTEWIHMAMTFDGLTETLYVNGEDVAHLDTGAAISSDDTPVSIGGGINETDVIEWVNGRFDEFQMYARSLSPAEILKLAGR